MAFLMGKSGRYPAKAGIGFLGLSLTATLFLTLMPVPEWQWETEKRFRLCILCTAGAVPDFFKNVLLFLPVGAALAFQRQRLWVTVLYGALLSLAIEMMQLGIPGRDPSLQDVASNTLGTFFGFGIAHSPFGPPVVGALGWFRGIWDECRRPSPKLATALVCGALLVTTSVLALTGWLLKPAFPPGPYEWLSSWLNLLWLGVWTFPIGFWSRTRLVFVGAVVILGSVIWWLPAFAGFAPTPLIQWVAVGVGLLMGIGTHRLMGLTAKGGFGGVVSSYFWQTRHQSDY